VTKDWIELLELCSRYSRGLDTKDYELLRTCFPDEVRLSYGTGLEAVTRGHLTYTTPEQFIESIRRIHGPLRTLHRNTNHHFDIDQDRATGRVYIDQFQVRLEEGTEPRTTQYVGWYDDAYVRTPTGWKFYERHSTVVWVTGGWLGEAADA
jgi:hypothetical protein